VSECELEPSTIRRPESDRAVEPLEKKCDVFRIVRSLKDCDVRVCHVEYATCILATLHTYIVVI
jgi:hypothetical protein